MRFLVTGATGKVGNAVARKLAKRGDDVVALVRDAANARELLPPGIEVAVGDVTDPRSLRRAADGIDGAFNCMGIFEQWMPDPGIFARVNAEGARNVVAAAREAGARRVVRTSTFDVFEAERGGTVREDGLGPRSEGHPLRALEAARRGARTRGASLGARGTAGWRRGAGTGHRTP